MSFSSEITGRAKRRMESLLTFLSLDVALCHPLSHHIAGISFSRDKKCLAFPSCRSGDGLSVPLGLATSGFS